MIKTNGVILMLLIVSFYSFSQDNCAQDYTIYRNEYKQKNYDQALESWRRVYVTCPEYNENTFKDAPKMFAHKIKTDPKNKEYYIDTLMMVYDQRIFLFGNRGYVLSKKGSDLLRYASERYEEAYHILKEGVTEQGNSSLPTPLVSYFKALTKCEKNGKNIEKQDVLEAYVSLTNIIDYNIIHNEKYASHYSKALTNIENLFSPYASCDDLLNVFQSRFDDNPEDVNLLKKITSLLFKKKCTDNDLYFLAANNLHKIDPSAQSAYEMGNMNFEKKNYDEAISYYNEAIQLNLDDSKLPACYLQLGYSYYMNGSYSAARESAQKSASLKDDWGNPYLLIGDIYAASARKCGDTPFERSLVYLVAVDAYNKARSIDDVLSEKANKKIYTYSKYFPSKEDCFFNDIEVGSNYKVGCWIGRSTKVRTRD